MSQLVKNTEERGSRARENRRHTQGMVIAVNPVAKTCRVDTGDSLQDGTRVYLEDVPYNPQTPPNVGAMVPLEYAGTSAHSVRVGIGRLAGQNIDYDLTVVGGVESIKKDGESYKVKGHVILKPGSGVTITRTNQTFEIAATAGHTIKDEGTPLTQRTSLNFVGDLVTATDDAGNNETDVTISSGLTTKGDLLSRTTAVLTRVPVGTDGQFLRAASAQASGLEWATPAFIGEGEIQLSPGRWTLLVDKFTGASGSNLTAHTSDSGHTWTQSGVSGWTQALHISNANRVRSADADADEGFVYASATPIRQEYFVGFDIYVADTNSTSQMGVIVRHNAAAGNQNGYRVYIYDQRVHLDRRVAGAGSWTSLGNVLLADLGLTWAAGETYEVWLEVTDARKTVYVNGKVALTNTDNNVTGAGRIGVWGRYGSNTAGLHLDNLRVEYGQPPHLTNKGDLLTFSSDLARLPVGSDGQVLTADSSQSAGLRWVTPTAADPGEDAILFDVDRYTPITVHGGSNATVVNVGFAETNTDGANAENLNPAFGGYAVKFPGTSSDNSAWFKAPIPRSVHATPNVRVRLHVLCAGTLQAVHFDVHFGVVTAGNIFGSESMGAANGITISEGASAGTIQHGDSTPSNVDGFGAGKLLFLRVRRDGSHPSDSSASPAYLLAVEVLFNRA